MRKFTFILLVFFTVTILGNNSNVYASTEPPTVTGKSVVIMDANTGAVVYGKEEHTQYPPASTTKLMTVLLTLENCELDEVVTVGAIPPYIEGSKVYIHEDEELTVEQLLYAVILASANDCAAALAEHISGSIESFGELMTSRAKELGAMNTNFTNPHGLYEENHRTTAYDLALIEKELLNYPKYIEISKTKSTEMDPTNKSTEKRPLWNDNRLLHEGYNCYYPDTVAGKTGYTDESKHSYVASAKKGDNAFIVAILYDEQKAYYDEVTGVFDWAFENFATEKFLSKGDEIGTFTSSNGTKIPLIINSDIYFTKDLTTDVKPTLVIDTETLKNKFFNAGEIITTATVSYNGQEYTVDVMSNMDYHEKVLPAFGNLVTTEKNTINYTKLVGIIVGSILGILLLLILLILIIRKRNIAKRRRKNQYLSSYNNKKKFKNY